jgi:D-glycero-D-manno-heptose 1,7-bisphosphate phosphatase
LEALAELGATGVPVAVVTNQSIIGRGLAPLHDVDAIHQWMQEVVSAHGGPRLAIYVCPHAPEDSCECRKPRPGLLLQAAVELDVDLTQSIFVGDSPSDVAAALAVGCHPILVGATPLEQTAWPASMVSCVPTLDGAVRLMREGKPVLASSDFAKLANVV